MTLTCSPDTNGEVSYVWLKDSEQFLFNSSKASSDFLTLNDLSKENSGVYIVETVVAGVARASNTVKLDVQCKYLILFGHP